MVFVVVDEIAFHLRWRHAAVRLRHVDDRQIEIWENINGHAHESEDRAERYADHQHHDRDRTTQGGAQQPHSYRPPCGVACKRCRNGCRSPCDAATAAKFCQTARRARASSVSACTNKL